MARRIAREIERERNCGKVSPSLSLSSPSLSRRTQRVLMVQSRNRNGSAHAGVSPEAGGGTQAGCFIDLHRFGPCASGKIDVPWPQWLGFAELSSWPGGVCLLVMVMAGVARTVRGPSMVPLLHFSCMSLCCLFFLPNNFFRRYC
jgi:hypothetical protein